MYVGRFVVVAPGTGAYRVSSRSFPNRRVIDRDGTLTVGPTPDAPETDNPYVSYNCARAVDAPTGDALAVVGNGSHVDPIAEKLERGYPARDALATALLALDFEKDDYDTPRIAGVVESDTATIGTVRRDALLALDFEKDDYDTPRIAGVVESDTATIGTVRRDALLVESVDEPTIVATYETDSPEPYPLAAADAADAADAATEVLDADFEHPVCAAGATVDADGVTLAFDNDTE